MNERADLFKFLLPQPFSSCFEVDFLTSFGVVFGSVVWDLIQFRASQGKGFYSSLRYNP